MPRYASHRPVELLGPGLMLIVATIIFGLLLHLFEPRDSGDGS